MIQIDLTGQVAVVTGGSSGIGLATAERFLQAGASVAICGRDGERLARAEAMLDENTRALNCSPSAATCSTSMTSPRSRKRCPHASAAPTCW
ncbi:short chain dehydrogenase family protein [Burkholderia cepacia]|nr:short chain dehydrogenase family protein [Burkholderia cepacia]